MRFLFITFIAFLFLFSGASAQTEVQTTVWQKFSPANQLFSVEFPQTPVDKSFRDEKREIETEIYTSFQAPTHFFVSSVQTEKQLVNPNLIKDFARQNGAVGKAGKIGQIPGLSYDFRDEENYYHRIFVVLTSKKIYTFHTVGIAGGDPNVERFFAGIKFSDSFSAEKQPDEAETNPTSKVAIVSAPKPPAPNSVGIGTGSGSGNGVGTGGGSGVGPGNGSGQSNPNAPKPEIEPIKILSKPRALYTDIARFYSIMGAVRLKITFLANGEIGSITPITKLPFGLTKNSIAAARQIRFEPATRGGTKISITKTVEYTFTIY